MTDERDEQDGASDDFAGGPAVTGRDMGEEGTSGPLEASPGLREAELTGDDADWRALERARGDDAEDAP